MKGFIFLLTIFLNVSLLAYQADARQDLTVRGQVYDAGTGGPIPNAGILVSETLQGTSSDSDGWFELRLTKGEYNIRVTSLGYAAKNIRLSVPSAGMQDLMIGLEQESVEIEGVDIFGRFFLADRDSSISREQVSIMPAITRINAVEIERQGAVTLTDAIKFVPGAWIETRGRKTKQFFSVRGQKYPYPDYSINGIWQKEFEETVYFMSALDIESIEIVRSSGALVKGLSGLTGVVDIKTKKPEKETVSMLVKYGEQSNYAANLSYGNRINDVSFTTTAALFGTDGPPGRNGKERIANLSGSADWRVSRKVQLSGGATYIGGLRQLVAIEEPGAANIANRLEKFDPIRTLLSYVKLNYTGDDGSLTEVQTNLAYRNLDYTNFNIVSQTVSEHTELDREYGFNMLHSRPLSPKNTLRAGVLYNHWVAPEGKRYYAGRACNVHTWSGVVASEQRAGRFLFDAGIRLISGYIVEFGGFGVEGSSAGFQDVQPIKDQAAPFEWQSALGASFMFTAPASLHYNFSGGTIAPRRGSLNEEGISLLNEKRFQHDLGFRYRPAGFNEISVSAFYALRKDALELSGATVITGNDYLVELYENIDKRSYGIELTTRVAMPAVRSLLFANATLMKSENMTEEGYEKDKKMPNTILNFGIQYDHSGFDANLYLNYTGPYSNNRFVKRAWIQENGDFPLGDFLSVDITAGYTFAERFSSRVFGEIKNLLDRKYLTVAGYPDPGRLFSIGARVFF